MQNKTDANQSLTPPVANALERVLEYLWEDEERDFRKSFTNDHIYRQLVVLQSWLVDNNSCEPIVLESLENVDHFGGCPLCGKNDGYLNIGRGHWFICNEHRTCWLAESNLFSSWREEIEEDWRQNHEQIANYLEVEPVRSTNGKLEGPN